MHNKKNNHKWLKLTLAMIVTGALLVILICGAAFIFISKQSSIYIADELTDIPRAQYALVLGAKVEANHEPSKILRQRLDAALELYQAKKVAIIVVSGGTQGKTYDEPDDMAAYLIKHNVPQSAILKDKLGYNTFHSCLNFRDFLDNTSLDKKLNEKRNSNLTAPTRNITTSMPTNMASDNSPTTNINDNSRLLPAIDEASKGAAEVIVVTSAYHLPRSVFLARNCQLNAYGYPAKDVDHDLMTRAFNFCRESLSRVKAIINIYIWPDLK